MKRNYGVTFAILLSAILVMGSVSAVIPVSDEPVSYPLYAGQDTLVGSIEVTNDGDNLYVTYVVDEPGWCLTETHLHVGDTPVTTGKNGGNPIPGQFDYKESHDCVLEYPYVVELDEAWEGSNVRIAAHAAVEKWGEEEFCEDVLVGYDSRTLTLVSDGDTLADGVPATLVRTPYNTGWTASVPDATWIWNAEHPVDPTVDETVVFTRAFAVDGAVTSAQIIVASDNTHSVDMNGLPVGFSDEQQNFRAGQERTYPMTNVIEGDNLLTVAVTNTGVPGAQDPQNPAGLLYRLAVNYDVPVYEEQCVMVPVLLDQESAWAATAPGETRFIERGNWATYVEYGVGSVCDLEGEWFGSVSLNGQTYDRFIIISDQDGAIIEGDLGIFDDYPAVYGPIVGEISGSSIYMFYDPAGSYSAELEGTLHECSSMDGTWVHFDGEVQRQDNDMTWEMTKAE